MLTRPRRRSRLLAVLVAGSLAVAACGGDDGDADTGTTTEEGAGASDGAFPVTIEHAHGETTIEARPERIVTVGLTEQDALLALGEVPVGATEWFGEHPGAIWPWAADELEALDAEAPVVVGDATAINFEKIAAQSPDLILALYADVSEADYEKLSAIAPTVAQPEGVSAYGISWQDATRTVGTAVGKADEAQALVEEVEAEFAAVVAAHPEFDGASALMATPYEGTFVYGPEDPRGRFLADLGFELPADLAEVAGDEFGGDLSEERSDLLDVDVIVWLDALEAPNYGGSVYQQSATKAEGREVHLSSFDSVVGGATSFVSVLSLPYLLENITPMLVAAVDGDPATEVPAAAA